MQTAVVIDDEPDVAEAIGIFLRRSGFTVELANEPEAGIQKVQRLLPDLVICDLRMPHPGGEAVIAQLKAQAETRHIPILVVSGHQYEAPERIGDAFLQKPFSLLEFTAVIKALTAAAGQTE